MKKILACGLCLALFPAQIHASAGTSSAAFLDIPVGAGPAALGSAYTALAKDAYAPTWNPAGLGILNTLQVAAQHLSYIQSTHYEYASFGLPLKRPRECAEGSLWCGASGVGASIQYFGSGDITALDSNGEPAGSFSAHSAAYNLSYGRAFGDKLALGMTGKLINVSLAGVSANAFAVDLGSFYELRRNLQLAATLTNMGSRLTFIDAGDPLPLAFHAAAAYQASSAVKLAGELVYPRSGPTSIRMGTEWMPRSLIALRLGYRTDTLKGQSPIAGLSTGFGVDLWGYELAYAWVPYGDLGDSHYFSLVMKFGEEQTDRNRNLIQISHTKPAGREHGRRQEPEYEELKDLLKDDDSPTFKRPALQR